MTSEQPKSVIKEVKKTIIDDEKPMDQKVPGSAFAVVSFSYLTILFIAIIGVGFAIWLFR